MNMTEELEKAAAVTLGPVTETRPLIPLFDRVLVKPIKEQKSELLVEDITGSTPTRGTVVAVGHETEFLQEGDEVLFKAYQADEIDDGALLMFQERNLLGVWR